jgi:hypothetical protein
MRHFAVILTHNRPELLAQTWLAIGPQVDMVIVLDNASSPPVDFREFHSQFWKTAVLNVPDQPPNLSKLWNLGIDCARVVWGARDDITDEPLYVAVLCDDAPPPPGWFAAVTQAMAETGAVVGASAPEPFGWTGPPKVKTERDSDLAHRMPGWAWILDPISPVRADERFEWWFGDTDLDLSARAAGGMVLIGTHPVPNIHPNDFSQRPQQAAQIAVDSQRFVEKYDGWRPW